MRKPAILVTVLIISLTNAQVALPDGAIVPFTTGLPVCASYCGPLSDVQGACGPTKLPTVDKNCFCTDSRLTVFDNAGTAGVTSVCGTSSQFSCTSQTDLQAIITWYDSYCGGETTTTTSTAAGGAVSTSTSTPNPGSSNRNQTWLQGHWKWVVMLVIVFFSIVIAWVVACIFRRRYLRKKEREIEMRPPVAWGPHQLQGMTGGYSYGDGVSDANRGGKTNAKVNEKGVAIMATPVAVEKAGKRESKGLKKKVRT